MKKGSAEYTEGCKEKYLDKCEWTKKKKVCVMGWAHGNIADAIYAKLMCKGHYTQAFDIGELTVGSPRADWDRYDTFIFNNGETRLDWIEEQEYHRIQSVVDNCLTNTMMTTSEIVDQTIDTHVIKTIIFIGSMAHNHVLNGSAPYCAAKAGLNMFAKCIGYELAPKGYRVFCINPSNVLNAPMSEETINGLMRYKSLSRDEAEAYWAAECPLGTFLSKDEIANIVAFCLTQEARYLSGTSIDLAGGGR